jgi:RsiW-degrading membrane proteinase PrsW (M82 family)
MTTDTTNDPRVTAALTTVRRLWLAAGVLSVVTLAVAAVLSAIDPKEVNWVVWLRGGVVTVACFVLVAATGAAARGSRTAYVRMRWISMLAPLGIVAIVLAPDSGYPVWMKVEQVLLGVLVVLVAVQLNQGAVRRAFRPVPTKVS